MEKLLGKTAGFCFGVERAVSGCRSLLQEEKKAYCLGELVHNGRVVRELEKAGMTFIDDLAEAKEAGLKVVIRAHGVPKEVYETAEKMKIDLVDFTCPMVLKIHNIVDEFNRKNYYVILTGKKEHPEVVGITSFADNISVIGLCDEVESALNDFLASGLNKLLLVSQTTFSLQAFDEIQREVSKRFPFDSGLTVKNTICNATEVRQIETADLAKQVDFMIIVGGKNSSNTRKLYDIAKKYCGSCVMIEDEDELLGFDFNGYDKVGVMAGASTPGDTIEAVMDAI